MTEVQISGINPATLLWLRSKTSANAVKICTKLIADCDWNLLQNPDGNKEPALILHGGKRGIVLLSSDELSPSRIVADHEHWESLLKQLPESWSGLTLLYLTDKLPEGTLQEQLEKSSSKNFLGKSISSAILASEGEHLGKLPKVLDDVKPADLDSDLATMFGAVRAQGLQFHQFLDRLNSTKSWGTYTIMALCVAIFAWGTAAGGTEDLWLLLRFGANFSPLTVEAGQWWRLIGSTFLHIGIVHLLVNMYSLKIVGETLEKFLGNARFLALYGLSGLGGSLASAFTGDARVSAGASGAIFGLIGACVVLGIRHKGVIPRSMRQSMVNGMLPALGYNLIFGFSVSGIDNSAHLGGLLAGAVAAWFIPPKVVKAKLSPALFAVFTTLAASMFLVQFFSLYQAVRGLELKSLPSRTEQLGAWSLSIPNLFEAGAEPGFFRGPSLLIITSTMEWQPESGVLDAESLENLIREQSKINFTEKSQESVNGHDWLVLGVDDQVSRRIAVRSEGQQVILIGVIGQLDSDAAINSVLRFLLSSTTHR